MKTILTFLGSVLASLYSPCLAEQKPNILFIFADDMAYDVIGAQGNKQVKTPHLDALASRGTRFTHAYNSGTWCGAVCVASRRMMMTGNQVWNAQQASVEQMVADGQLFPQLMQAAGYKTYYTGKWHVGKPSLCEKSWVNTVNVRPGMPNQTDARYQRNWQPGKDNWSPSDPKFQGFWRGGRHWSEVLSDDAQGLLKQASKQDKPFMMMLAFNAPHDPRQAPQTYQDMYPYKSIDIPASFQANYPFTIAYGSGRDESLAPFPRTEYSIQVNRSEYYALISHMDEQIGKILKALEESGKLDNTIIIFSADHGLAVGQHGLVGKQNVHEHSVRSPWIIAGKGIPIGKQVNQGIYIQDAMATCLDIAGVQKPNYVEFSSVLPLLQGDNSKARQVMYSCYIDSQRMVIKDGIKYISYPAVKKELLFNLVSDPLELKDLSKDPQFRKLKESLQSELLLQIKQMNDPIDLANPRSSMKAVLSKKNRSKKVDR